MGTRPTLEHAGTQYVCLCVDDLPSEIGRAFAEMGSDEQARFWDAVAAATTRYERQPCFQWSMMVDAMTDAGKHVISEMHEQL